MIEAFLQLEPGVQVCAMLCMTAVIGFFLVSMP